MDDALIFSLIRFEAVGDDADPRFRAECGMCDHDTGGNDDGLAIWSAAIDHLKNEHGIVVP